MKYWEIIADNLSKAGWSWGCVSAISFNGRTMWIVDANRDNGKRFVVRSDGMLTAFLELERITHELALSAIRFSSTRATRRFRCRDARQQSRWFAHRHSRLRRNPNSNRMR
jgi:hypothetical protein